MSFQDFLRPRHQRSISKKSSPSIVFFFVFAHRALLCLSLVLFALRVQWHYSRSCGLATRRRWLDKEYDDSRVFACCEAPIPTHSEMIKRKK